MTRIARIVAEEVDDATRRVILICGLDREHRLVDGEWMGYCADKTGCSSFVMTAETLQYDGYHTELHNFAKRPIVPSELFTICEQADDVYCIYRVRSVSFYSPADQPLPPNFDELSNALALHAMQNIGLEQFTVSTVLDESHPDAIKSFRLFGDELAKAFLQGVAHRVSSVPVLAEAHEHDATRSHS